MKNILSIIPILLLASLLVNLMSCTNDSSEFEKIKTGIDYKDIKILSFLDHGDSPNTGESPGLEIQKNLRTGDCWLYSCKVVIGYLYYRFKPEKSGSYNIIISNNTTDLNCWLFFSKLDFNEINCLRNGVNGITAAELEKGHEYFLMTEEMRKKSGTFDMNIILCEEQG